MTDKFGKQFIERSLSKKRELFEEYINEYKSLGNDISFIIVVSNFDINLFNEKKTQFCLESRSYLPVYSLEEYKFIRFLLYEKAKFLPITIGL
jgi:hypothetical protein